MIVEETYCRIEFELTNQYYRKILHDDNTVFALQVSIRKDEKFASIHNNAALPERYNPMPISEQFFQEKYEQALKIINKSEI